jgi:hypothetical protein
MNRHAHLLQRRQRCVSAVVSDLAAFSTFNSTPLRAPCEPLPTQVPAVALEARWTAAQYLQNRQPDSPWP